MKRRLVLLMTCLFCSIGLALAQNKRISGTVVDSNGQPVTGATVVVKGTTVGVSTDIDGKYSISVPQGSKTLVISLIGSKNKEVGVGDGLKITLESDSQSLDEVVVTSLGIKKSQKAIGYSVSKVSSEDLIKSGESNVINGLAAKASGVQITSSSGTPGASTKIVLRGLATFSGDNQPLIVIDGVPMSNDVNSFTAGDDPYNGTLAGVQTANRALDLNPEDIESVTILKGPTAAAIYGQAAGNGVIIYTTKRGHKEKGLGITYNGSLEISNVSKLPEIQKQYGQGDGGVYSASTANSWGPDLTKSGGTVYDNIGNFFKTSYSYVNNLSIVGGNDKSSFRASINATNTNGVIPESKLDRYTTRLTSDFKITDWLNVGGTMSYTNTKGTLVQNGSNLSGVMLSLLRMPVDYDVRDYIDAAGNNKNFVSFYDNPLFTVKKNPFTDETDRFLGNFYFDVKLNKVFTLSSKTGIDTYNTTQKQIYAYSSNGNDYGDGTGQVNRIKVAFRNVYSDLLLKFNKSFGQNKDFTLNGLLGGNYNYNQKERTFERGRIMTIPGFYGFSGMKELYVSDRDWYSESKAVFLDATVDYKSIVFLTLTGRKEWSSTFGKGSSGFFYPKADVSYVFSHLLKDKSIISYGKIRFAYANVGISPSVYNDKTYYTVPSVADGMTNGLSFPYNNQPGYAISNTISGFDLKPERNIGKEVGLELNFLENRITFEGTYYNQTSKDLLISQPVAPSSGFQYKYYNIGKIRNTGLELSASAKIVELRKFKWNISANWSKNKNKVLQLAPNVTEIAVGSGFTTPKSYAIVGEPFGVFYGVKFQRDDNGNLLINPASGLPIAQSTEQKLGNPNPKWTMGINNTFSYANFTLSCLLDIRHGGDIWNGTWSVLNNRGKSLESGDRDRTYVIDGVYASGANAGQKNTTEISARNYYGTGYLGKSGSEIDIQSGSWFRLRTVNLSYVFNIAKQNPNFPVRNVEVGASLKNMILSTNYKGVDPETSLTGAGQNLAGYDYFNNPGTKSVLFNVKVVF
jgi:TonB-linked SusC/RagA family outer membrane protein